MEEWEKIKLKEVLTEITERNKGEKVKLVLSVTNSQGFVSQEEYFEGTVHSQDISNYKIVRKNQFAYNPSRINVGSIDILKKYEGGVLSPMYVVFKVDETRLLPEYFKYFFQTHRFEENVKNNTQGSVRNSLSFKSLADFEYYLPPLKEQERIVKILEKADLIIKKYESLLEEKNHFIKSQFDGMFASIGEKISLSEISQRITDGSHNPPKGEKNDTGYYMLSSQNIENGTISYENIRFLNKKDFERENKRTMLEKGDILFSIVGSIGKTAIFQDDKKVTFQRSVAIIKCNNSINKKFLEYSLLSNDIKKQVYIMAKGGAQEGIYLEDLKKIKIKNVNLEKQNQFAKIIEIAEKQKIELEKIIENYEKLKKGLMQQLLTGKIKVKI